MSTGTSLNEYGILATVAGRPRLLRILAINGRVALSVASLTGTHLITLFQSTKESTK